MTHDSDSTDRARDVTLDASNLKGLAHPLRARLLGALREAGPATASQLADRLGESSGATSYHLRQLQRFGFVTEEAERGSGRERWWRAAHESTYIDEGELLRNPRTAALGSEFFRSVVDAYAARMFNWIEKLPSFTGEWLHAGTMSDWALRLTPAQLGELEAELEAVIRRYPRFDPEEPQTEGAAYVAVQLQLLPRVEA